MTSSTNKFIAYYRVSTDMQGESGLGLEAQQSAVRSFVSSNGGELISEHTEIETGRNDNRPELEKAIEMTKNRKATLLVAKLDRLARSVYFTAALQKSGVDFICCDMPNANELTINILSAVAQNEAQLISKRTTDALAQAKARGIKLGAANDKCKKGFTREEARKGALIAAAKASAAANEFYRTLEPVVKPLLTNGASPAQIANTLNQAGYRTRQGREWKATSVSRAFSRIADAPIDPKEVVRQLLDKFAYLASYPAQHEAVRIAKRFLEKGL